MQPGPERGLGKCWYAEGETSPSRKNQEQKKQKHMKSTKKGTKKGGSFFCCCEVGEERVEPGGWARKKHIEHLQNPLNPPPVIRSPSSTPFFYFFFLLGKDEWWILNTGSAIKIYLISYILAYILVIGRLNNIALCQYHSTCKRTGSP
jgi:hypothetical protein